MDTFYVILGFIIIYTLVHGAVIVAKKIQGTSTYENVVLVAAGVVVLISFAGLAG